MAKRAADVLKQAERGNGGGVGEIEDDRPWRTYYNPYGDAHRLPSDPVQMSLYMEAGWTLHKPSHPLKRPVEQKMRDGSIFNFGSASQDVSESELARFNTTAESRARHSAPTATYYTTEGTALENLPADPESMEKYLAAGLSLNPPIAAKASGTVQLLRKEA